MDTRISSYYHILHVLHKYYILKLHGQLIQSHGKVLWGHFYLAGDFVQEALQVGAAIAGDQFLGLPLQPEDL